MIALRSMPFIKRIEKKPRNRTEKRDMRSKYYASSTWRKMREGYMMQHNYLCEICDRHGVVSPATQCHHIISPFTEENTDYYFYNANNLMCLCDKCHGELHGNKKESDWYWLFWDRENGLMV